MSDRLTKEAFEKLVQEDIDWLLDQPRSLERDHILMILRDAPGHYYPERYVNVPFHDRGGGELHGTVTGAVIQDGDGPELKKQ